MKINCDIKSRALKDLKQYNVMAKVIANVTANVTANVIANVIVQMIKCLSVDTHDIKQY